MPPFQLCTPGIRHFDGIESPSTIETANIWLLLPDIITPLSVRDWMPKYWFNFRQPRIAKIFSVPVQNIEIESEYKSLIVYSFNTRLKCLVLHICTQFFIPAPFKVKLQFTVHVNQRYQNNVWSNLMSLCRQN